MQEVFDSWDRLPGTERHYAPTFSDDPELSRRAFDKTGRSLTRSGVNFPNAEINSRVTEKFHPTSQTYTRAITLFPGELNSLENFRRTMLAKFPNSQSWYIVFSRGSEAVSSSVFDSHSPASRGSFVNSSIKTTISSYGVTSPIAGGTPDITLTVVMRESL